MLNQVRISVTSFAVSGRNSATYQRWRHRLFPADHAGRAEIPSTPAGIKLEVTHSCNLQCPFCYTDSPRRTRERTFDLDDDTWMKTVEQAIELGAVEAVVTGGEPLLRRELSLGMIERLSQAGLGVTLNTNGWFLDDAVCNRLAGCDGLQVNISLDGGSPGVHDAIRGVPGSWKRAVEGIDRLLQRGVRVRVVSVITPANQEMVEDLLASLWLLGVPSVRLAVVVPAGAAARSGDWSVNRARLYRIKRRSEERLPGMPVELHWGNLSSLARVEDLAPWALMVRPNGLVLMDSTRPFAFGNVREGLDEVWRRIEKDGWRDARVVEWAGHLKEGGKFGGDATVPYLDEEIAMVPGLDTGHPGEREAKAVPEGVPVAKAEQRDLDLGLRMATELDLARRYRSAPGRSAGKGYRTRVVRVAESGKVFRLNGSAGVALDVLSDGSPGDLVEALARLHSELDRDQLTRDSQAATRMLLGFGVIEPVQAERMKPPASSASTKRPTSSAAA